MYTVIDIETTGFRKYDSNNRLISDILEFGYINVGDDLQILNHGTLYFYEKWFDIENDSQQYHKITREFLEEHAKDNLTNAAAMQAMLTNTIVVGKNAKSFDIPFINDWLKKMYGDDMDISATTDKLQMKGYYGGYVYHDNDTRIYDVQSKYAPFWRADTGASSQRKGKLEEYIDSIPGAKDMVEEVYAGLEKERSTGAHGALYDCVMTYVVFIYSIIRNGGLT